MPPSDYLVADRGYDSNALRSRLIKRGAIPVIPSRSNRKVQIRHDRQIYRQRNVVERMFSRFKGYDGDRFRESLLMQGILPIIPPRSNRKVPEHPDYRRYRDRNRVERMFGKLKQQRRIATRYDKTVLSFESFLNLAAVRLWQNLLSTQPSTFC